MYQYRLTFNKENGMNLLKNLFVLGLFVALFCFLATSRAQECLYAGTDADGLVFRYVPDLNSWQSTALIPGIMRTNKLYYSLETGLLAGCLSESEHITIYKSNNMGGSWSFSGDFIDSTTISDFFRSSDDTLWVGMGFPGQVYTSVDSGESWQMNTELDDVVYSFCETSSGELLAGTGSQGHIFRTNDGHTWRLSATLPDVQNIYSILKLSSGTLLCGVGDYPGALYMSIDDGNNWTILNWHQGSNGIYKLVQDADDRLYALERTNEYSYKVWYSDDMAMTWSELPDLPGSEIYDLMVDEKKVVYVAAGYDGNVYKWNRGAARWLEVGSFPATNRVFTVISAPCTEVTPTPTFTPRPTPTPRPEGGTYSSASHDYFYPGERFLYVVDVYHYPEKSFSNGTENRFYLYVALEVYGVFYFYPSWTEEIDFVELEDVPPGATESISVFDFTWPDVDGSAMNLRLWSVILEAESGDMYGRYDVTEFGYGPPPTATPTSIPTPTPIPPRMAVYFNNDDSPLSWTCGDERIYCFGTTHNPTGYYRVATVKNEGGATLMVDLALSGESADLFEIDGELSFTLAPGVSRDVRIRFAPEPPPGEKEAILEISGADKSENMTLKGGYSF